MIYVQSLQALGLGFELIAYLLFGAIFGVIVGLFLRFKNNKKMIYEEEIDNKNEEEIDNKNEEEIDNKNEEEISEKEIIEEKLKNISTNKNIEEVSSTKLKSIF